MANIKWSGIEQKKYGLTARWYVSAQYGNDTDVDAVGYYDPSTNPTGHGGPTRPFATLDKAIQEADGVIVIDSGYYESGITFVDGKTFVGDGNVEVYNLNTRDDSPCYNLKIIQSTVGDSSTTGNKIIDCKVLFSNVGMRDTTLTNSILIDCQFNSLVQNQNNWTNIMLIRCSGIIVAPNQMTSLFILDSPSLRFTLTSPRPSAVISDYSIIIGTVSTNILINGKTSGVTIEDFKSDGNYFSKSFSEVDLFGNASGSGASVVQLQTIFNNYFSPIYLDNWQYLDMSLKLSVDDRVRYGGLSGHFIGALPVGYSYDISTLWNTYKDVGNTSNVELDSISGNLVLSSGQTTGIFTTTEIVLPNAIEADVAMFFKNNVYNSNGVAVQRIDTTDDEVPSNLVEQRTVYSYRLKTSPDSGTALGVWKEYELDRAPTVDESGNSNINDSFDKQTETTQIIKKFALEITLRDLS